MAKTAARKGVDTIALPPARPERAEQLRSLGPRAAVELTWGVGSQQKKVVTLGEIAEVTDRHVKLFHAEVRGDGPIRRMKEAWVPLRFLVRVSQ